MSETAKARTYLVPTEQSTLRTEFGKIYVIGPGRYEAYQSAIQIHARRGEDWHEIDAQFREKDGLFVSEGPVITVCCATSERTASLRYRMRSSASWRCALKKRSR